MIQTSPIVGTIEVVRCGPTGILALVDGQRQFFPDLDAVFRTAIGLLDEQAQPQVRPGPSPRQGGAGHPLPLPGFSP
jgi:hypothetical protein